MKKQIMLFIVALAFVLTISGAASAATNVNTTSTEYQIGQQVTQQALDDTSLGLNQSDKNLVITTASTATLNGTTTEDSLQAVVDKTSVLSTGKAITLGSGNLLVINDPDGPLWFAFISQTGNTLMAKTFTISPTGKITISRTVNIGTAQTNANFQQAIAALGSNGYNIANTANLWAAGAPADLMAITFTTGGINQGTIDNYAETKSFALKYTTGSNYIITNAGGMDDDALLYGPFGFNDILFSTSSGTPGETAFINYNTDSTTKARTGILALMKGNDLTSQFGSVTAGTLSEIKFNLWLLNKLKTSPQDLFSVLSLKNVDENNIAYLWYDKSLGYGHGIDETYISSLTDVEGGWTSVSSVIPITDYAGMFALGQQAYANAVSKGLFTTADLAAGRVAVSLAPYYVNHQGTRSLVGFIDGVVSAGQAALQAAGINAEGFTIDNILSIRNSWMWSGNIPAIFITTTQESQNAYAQHKGENQAINYLTITSEKTTFAYDSATSSYKSTVTDITDLSPSKIQSGTFLGSYIIPAPAGLLYAWSAGAPYSYLRTIARVGCICSTREYDLATMLQGQYPLGSNEYYILTVLTGAGETNRQISGRTTAWGVSSGMGSYYSVGQTSDTGYQLIVTIWDEIAQTGRSMLIAYNGDPIATAMANSGYTNNVYKQEADLFWHLDHGWVDQQNVIASAISSAQTLENMNQDFLNTMNSAGLDPIAYMLNYVTPSVEVDTATGVYNSDLTVTINSPGTIYYTTDGTTPTVQSPVYSGPISIAQTTTLQYMAVEGSYFSPVYKETYIINEPTPTPNTGDSGINAITAGFVGSILSIYNAITGSSTPAAATSEATSGLPLEQSTPTSLPVGVIVGVLVIVIAAILVYLGRHTIYAAITGRGGSEK